MTVETATNFINHSTDRGIIEELEAAFDGFRSRIAMLSVEASGTLTSMFTPLGPVDAGVVDTGVDAIEWEQFEIAIAPIDAQRSLDPQVRRSLNLAGLSSTSTPQQNPRRWFWPARSSPRPCSS